MESNDENDTAGTERSFFVEKEEVLRLIIFLLCHDDKNLKEIAELDKLKKILDAYQEQPQLLGPHIEEMVLPLNTWLTQMIEQNVSDIQWEKFHLVCKIYYHITKVRGFKRISKYFPHEVYQLEPCLAVLHIQVIVLRFFPIFDLFLRLFFIYRIMQIIKSGKLDMFYCYG